MADKGAPVITVVEEAPGEVLRAYRESKHMLRPDFASWTADAQGKEWNANLVRDLEDGRIAFTKRHYDDINRSWWGEEASDEDIIWRERLRRAILRQKVAAGTKIDPAPPLPLPDEKEQVTVTFTKRRGRQIVVTLLIPTMLLAFLGWKYAVEEWMTLNFGWGLGGGGVYDFNDFIRLLKVYLVVVVVGLLLSLVLRVLRWPKFVHETDNGWLVGIVGNLGLTFSLFMLIFIFNDGHPVFNPKMPVPLMISLAFGLLCYGFAYLLAWAKRRTANLTPGQTSLK